MTLSNQQIRNRELVARELARDDPEYEPVWRQYRRELERRGLEPREREGK